MRPADRVMEPVRALQSPARSASDELTRRTCLHPSHASHRKTSGLRKLRDAQGQVFDVSRLALPDDEDLPAEQTKTPQVAAITLGIASQLRRRILASYGAPLPVLAPMGVPVAPADVDDLPMPRQNQVRVARQVTAMQAKSISEPMNDPSDDQLRRRVLRANASHAPTLFNRDRRCPRLIPAYGSPSLRHRQSFRHCAPARYNLTGAKNWTNGHSSQATTTLRSREGAGDACPGQCPSPAPPAACSEPP